MLNIIEIYSYIQIFECENTPFDNDSQYKTWVSYVYNGSSLDYHI